MDNRCVVNLRLAVRAETLGEAVKLVENKVTSSYYVVDGQLRDRLDERVLVSAVSATDVDK